MDTSPDLAAPVHTARTLDDLEKWLSSPANGSRRPVLIFLYYVAILIALLLIYGRGDFETAPFIYQGF